MQTLVPSRKIPVRIHFCRVVFTRQAIGNGRQSTKKSGSMFPTPFRKNATLSMQLPGWLVSHDLDTGEHLTLETIEHTIK
jgi:hypothetical protein